MLASALWRRLFSRQCSDPERLECVIHFIRQQVGAGAGGAEGSGSGESSGGSESSVNGESSGSGESSESAKTRIRIRLVDL